MSALKGVEDNALRAQLMECLRGGNAHVDPRTAISGIPEADRDKRPHGLPHSPWQLIEHMRLTLQDLYEFSTNPEYAAPEWPRDYWPAAEAVPSHEAWQKTCDGFLSEIARFESLVEDPATDLLAPIGWGQGQNILREALLVLTHNSYHLGQLVLLRQLLGCWQH
jgi:hypothetical protein